MSTSSRWQTSSTSSTQKHCRRTRRSAPKWTLSGGPPPARRHRPCWPKHSTAASSSAATWSSTWVSSSVHVSFRTSTQIETTAPDLDWGVGRRHSVTYPEIGQHVARDLSIRLNFGTDPFNKRANEVEFIAILAAPDGLQHLAVQHHLARITCQVREHVELSSGEVHLDAIHANYAATEVHFQTPVAVWR